MASGAFDVTNDLINRNDESSNDGYLFQICKRWRRLGDLGMQTHASDENYDLTMVCHHPTI